MSGQTVNGEMRSRYVDGGAYVARANERGLPVGWIGKAPDLETAVYAAERMGPGYVAGTWAYRVA